MNPALFFLAFTFGLIGGYFLLIALRRPKPRTVPAHTEYWVYLPEETMPTQDAVMTRMIAENPYARRGRSPVGPNEGLVFSDVRLHIALVLRKKNPHAFSPGLFDPHIEPNADQLAGLDQAKSFVKLRYLSEEPLADRRHLQFLSHAADAYAALGNALVIYDAVAERLWSREELQQLLRDQFDMTQAPIQTQVIWVRSADGGHAESRGLRKMGIPEVRTRAAEGDQQVIIRHVLETAIEKLWEARTLPEAVEVEAYGDRFRLMFPANPRSPRAETRILRAQST